jgi:hypothetical protein
MRDNNIESKHEESKKQFPQINLSDNEYIIFSVEKSLIGLVPRFIAGGMIILLLLVFLFNYGSIVKIFHFTGPLADTSSMVLPVLLFVSLTFIGLYISYYVYSSNQLFLTNESVIQEIQTGLFSHFEQIISLEGVEDVSYHQDNFMQYIFNYGAVRLSTIGDETTYRMECVSNPKKYADLLNDAVEAFKNKREVDTEVENSNIA